MPWWEWPQTRYRLTIEEAIERCGEGNYELLEWSREVRNAETGKILWVALDFV